MTIKDELISEIAKHYLSERVFDFIKIDFEEEYQVPEKIEESKRFLNDVGSAIEIYVSSVLKGAGINPDEEINSDNDLASNLLMKVLTGEKSDS